jgi:hypothetical protein
MNGPLECWLGWPAGDTLLYFGPASIGQHRANGPVDRVGSTGRQAEEAREPSCVAWAVRPNMPEPPRGLWQIFPVDPFRFM